MFYNYFIYQNLIKKWRKQMKIAIITDVLGEENNGTTITTKRLIENMQKKGHEVFVVSPSTSQEKGYYSLPKRNFLIFNKYIAKNGVVLAAPDKKLLTDIISKVDIVHILLPFKTGQAALKIANELNKPVTTAFHSQAENITAHLGLKNFKPANNYIYKRFLNKFYKHAKYIHCPSPFIAKTIRNHGYNMDLRVISNGVTPIYQEIETPKPKEFKNKFIILFIGRLSKEKRHDLLIEAINYSKHKNNIQLIFAGDGPLKKKLEKQGKTLPSKPIIQFFSKEKLVKVINYSDLYVHPSDIEIEAIACLEAISCGKIPLISDSKRSATNAFALSDKNLFEAGNPKNLAEKIDYFIDNPNEIKIMKETYKNYAEQFKLSACMNQMEQMFFDAINQNKQA